MTAAPSCQGSSGRLTARWVAPLLLAPWIALVAGCGGGLDPVLGTPGIDRVPTVVSTTPATQDPMVMDVPLGQNVSATFSQAMAVGTLNGTSFTLACPAAAPVAGVVSYDAATFTATLAPAAMLPADTVCTATLGRTITDNRGVALASDYVWSFRTGMAPDLTRPTVTFARPVPGAGAVPSNGRVFVTFSEDMAPASLDGNSFTLVNATLDTPVAGSVSYNAASRTASFTPTGGTLALDTQFTATVTQAATDLVGNGLAGKAADLPAGSSFVWQFHTALGPDLTRPTVEVVVPANNAVGVASNTRVSASFSEDMAAATIDTASFMIANAATGTPVAGRVSYNAAARTATFTPTGGNLAVDTLFTATLSQAATDLAGNGLSGKARDLPAGSDFVWQFTTAAAGDNTPPTVTDVSPADGSTTVCRTKSVTATFSEAIDADTVTGRNFAVVDTSGGGGPVDGSVSYDAATLTATFTPSQAAGLPATSPFMVTLKSGATGIADLAGNPLAADKTWNFTTSISACPKGVPLGGIAAFGAFGGGAGLTNQGLQTVVGGDMGTTAACTTITGFHDGQDVYTETPLNKGIVNGSIVCAPPAPGTVEKLAIATQARIDAQAAWSALAALPPGTDPGAGELGGLVLAPDTYTSSIGSFGITSGDLVLDAKGDSGAIWVFQMGSSLTVGLPATPRHVLLINGAKAKNVYWQVGSAARIADGSAMVGTIIAPAGVTVSTAGQTAQTTLVGRAIGLNASVTLVNTTITMP